MKKPNSKYDLSFILHPSSFQSGFTLIELVITIAVLAVLTLGTIPLVQNAVRRQREQRLREILADVRTAIDEFHRDAIGGCPNNPIAGQQAVDPRSRVVIADCKIFGVENYDRYPPTLETLTEGVGVKPSSPVLGGGGKGSVFDDPNGGTGKNQATDPKKKTYLRELPIDPITGKSDWKLCSPYQPKCEGEWDNVSVFDVRSSADGEALDGTKYSAF